MKDQYKLGSLPLEKINATFSCHVESGLTMALHPYDLHHPLKDQVSMQWNVRICFGGPRCPVEKGEMVKQDKANWIDSRLKDSRMAFLSSINGTQNAKIYPKGHPFRYIEI